MKKSKIPGTFEGPDVYEKIKNDTRPLVLYGMGNGADKLIARLLELGRAPAAVFASDEFVRGQSFHGMRVRRFAEICEEFDDFLILIAFATRQGEVMARLFRMARAYPCLCPDLPVAGGEYQTLAFCCAHRAEMESAYALFEDDLSRQVFSSAVYHKLTGELSYLEDATSSPEECMALFEDKSLHTVLDGGAYDGDTLKTLLARHTEIRTAIAVEPDRRNYKRLCAYIEKEALGAKVTPVRAALSDRVGEAEFSVSGNRNASLYGASYESRSERVPLTTVDALVGDGWVDYIKYDVEGEEENALLGSRATIARCAPVLAVSLYHRARDLFRLPLLIREMCPDYRFYLRRTPCIPAWEITLYCIKK